MPQQNRSPAQFIGLVFALSVPLWLIGGSKLPLPVNLPTSALTTFVPALAAVILIYRQSGAAGIFGLLRRVVDFRRIPRKRWLLPCLLLAPLLYVISYIFMRGAGLPLPEVALIPWQTLPGFFALYFVSAAGEEIGWTAYAIEPMQARHGTLPASFLLGVVWAVWHAATFLQTGNPPDWVLWQSLKTVAMRVLIVWLYNHVGHSLFAVILYHTSDNLGWSLFPTYGSHYNPQVTSSLSWLVVGLILAIRGIAAGTGRRAPRPV
jgi:membrane protease YdiL (CAAX protease family)